MHCSYCKGPIARRNRTINLNVTIPTVVLSSSSYTDYDDRIDDADDGMAIIVVMAVMTPLMMIISTRTMAVPHPHTILSSLVGLITAAVWARVANVTRYSSPTPYQLLRWARGLGACPHVPDSVLVASQCHAFILLIPYQFYLNQPQRRRNRVRLRRLRRHRRDSATRVSVSNRRKARSHTTTILTARLK